MTQRTRTIILLVFMGLFVISAPIVVIYSAGYRLNLKKGNLEKTGILLFDTTPSGVSIDIDGKRHEQGSPARIKDIFPKEYDIRLSKEGYHAWEKRLRVEPGRTTFVNAVTLFKQAEPRALYTGPAELSASGQDSSRIALVSENESGITYHLFDMEQGDIIKSAFHVDDGTGWNSIGMEWSAQGTKLLATEASGGSERHLVIDASDGEQASMLQDELPDTEITAAKWDRSSDNIIFFISQGILRRINLLNGDVRQVMEAEDVIDYQLRDRKAYVISRHDETVRLMIRPLDDDGAEIESYILPYSSRYRFLESTPWQLTILDEKADILYLISKEEPSRIDRVFTSVKNAAWHGEVTELLLWNDFELWVFDGSNTELLTRFGSPIRDAAWHESANYILHVGSEGVSVIELDDRDKRNIFRLSQGVSADTLYVSRDGTRAFMVGTYDGKHGLWSLDIADKDSLLSL